VIRNICKAGMCVVGSWNWKAAILSATGRAPVFLISTARFGLRAMSVAGSVELVFRFLLSGVLAGVTQNVRSIRPLWRALVCITVLIPSASLVLDWLVHRMMHTPNLKTGIWASLVISVITALFDWYSMSRGVLIVGEEGKSFAADLSLLPSLIAGFVTEPFRLLRNSVQPLESPAAD
jgi:hypothetical protein